MAVINGTSGADTLADTSGDDTINGLAGNDTINGGNGGSDVVNGGDGRDTLAFMTATGAVVVDFVAGMAGTTSFTNIEKVVTGDFNDHLTGDALAQNLTARAGADTLAGGGGIDTLWGGAGADTFIFRELGTANADSFGDWTSGQDTLLLDAAVMTALGASGDFTAGDTRFWASSSGTAHDADDRIIFNTSTRQIFYDADGNGSGAAQLIATLQTGATLVATDITVEGSGPIVGTDGNDWLDGTVGDDTINGLGGRDTIHGGDGDDVMDGGSGNDFLNGGEGADTFIGGEGNDTLYSENSPDDGDDFHVETLDGGLGDDYYIVDNANDVLIDAGGIDTVQVWTMDWTLGAGFENLDLASGPTESSLTGIGNELDNHMSLSFGGALHGRDGDDTLVAGDPDGGENHLFGDAGDDWLFGGTSFDVLDGGAGNDTLVGQTADFDEIGEDFAFSAAPGSANADLVVNFDGFDQLRLDGTVMTELGVPGRFDSDDERFHAAADATGGHDADDRIVYNTATGELFYDADGSGSAAAQLLATLQGIPHLFAWQIAVDNPAIVGTQGNDSLNGTAGNDSIAALGGDDTINGLEGHDAIFGGVGDDLMAGGSGNDSIWGGDGADNFIGGAGNDTLNGENTSSDRSDIDIETMDGGLGDDFYGVDNAADVLTDAGGTDTVQAWNMDWTLGAGFENLIIHNDEAESGFTGIGNELDNQISATYAGSRLEGRDGDDTLIGANGQGVSNELLGGAGNDSLVSGGLGGDRLDGGTGVDTLTGAGSDPGEGENFVFSAAPGTANADIIVNFGQSSRIVLDGAAMPQVGASGTFVAGDGRFAANSSGIAQDANDRVIYDTDSGQIWYDADGNGTGGAQLIATLQGAPGVTATDIVVENGTGPAPIVGTEGNDTLTGTDGDDTINGLGGNDWIGGRAGNDHLRGGDGNDSLWGEDGDDIFYGDPGADLMIGDAGDDYFRMLDESADYGEGDRITGDAGFDTLDFSGSMGASGITLQPGGGVTGGGAGGAGRLQWGSIDQFIGTRFADQLTGHIGNTTLVGGDGDDTIEGNLGNDQLHGQGGADSFVFSDRAEAANADVIADFASGIDEIRLNAEAMPTLGAAGEFSADDARFYAAAGATAGHDADDRVIYNTTTGELFYDQDGSGSLGAELIATVGGDAVAATDIVIYGTGNPDEIIGTQGDDSLVGTPADNTIDALEGNDTLHGLAGDDELHGGDGADSIVGGDGNDVLAAGDGGLDRRGGDGAIDTLDGGMGDDVYWVSENDVILPDSGGVDTVNLLGGHFTLGAGLENLDLSDGFEGGSGTGNELDNVMSGAHEGGTLHGMGGNDRLGLHRGSAYGGEGNDTLSGQDEVHLDGGAGNDLLNSGFAGTLSFSVAPGAANADVVTGFNSNIDRILLDGNAHATTGPSGRFADGDARFWSSTTGTAHDADDRVVYNTTSGELWYDVDGGGAGARQLIATLEGAPTLVARDIWIINGSVQGQVINGTSGADTLADTTGNDTINGFAGNDTINGGSGGTDVVNGGDGRDSLQFMTATGAVVADFVAGVAGTTSFTNIEKVVTGDFNDQLTGDGLAQNLTARSGADTLAGGGGVDTLWGGAGPDTFIFRENGTANADVIGDWTSGSDEVALDNAAMGALGADGAFVAGDARFWSSSTGVAHDASDRIIYNTNNGQLFYDADGNGSAAAQLIATLTGSPTVVATDISVI
jgi:Ca2+-binding RTX toxin-like protein